MSRIYDELLECNKTHEITLRILQIIVICHEKIRTSRKTYQNETNTKTQNQKFKQNSNLNDLF